VLLDLDEAWGTSVAKLINKILKGLYPCSHSHAVWLSAFDCNVVCVRLMRCSIRSSRLPASSLLSDAGVVVAIVPFEGSGVFEAADGSGEAV
jgi:hypothetical protein